MPLCTGSSAQCLARALAHSSWSGPAPPRVAFPPVPPTGVATGARPRPTTSPTPTPGEDKATPTPRSPPLYPTCPLTLPLGLSLSPQIHPTASERRHGLAVVELAATATSAPLRCVRSLPLPRLRLPDEPQDAGRPRTLPRPRLLPRIPDASPTSTIDSAATKPPRAILRATW